MIVPGMVSVTFRKKTPAEIVGLTARAGLAAIEWGGDIHVPPGDPARADEVGRMTREAGLQVASYGSYYRCGHSAQEGVAFEPVLETALALGAPRIRVWAGKGGSAQADDAVWAAVVADARRVADRAAGSGLHIAFEYHANTLTDTPASTRRLLDALPHPAVFMLWQPPSGRSDAECTEALREVLPRLAHLHVFHWAWENGVQRRPLAEGQARWRVWLGMVERAGRDHEALLEFVRNDDESAFLEDAAVLRRWIESAAGE